MIGQERALEIAYLALKSVVADEVEIMLTAEQAALTRFCYSTIHQNIERQDLLLSVRVIADGCLGQAYTSSESAEALRDAGRKAVEIALNHKGEVASGFSAGGPAQCLPTFYAETAGCDANERAAITGRMATVARARGFHIHGSVDNEQSELAVITSNGAEQYARFTKAGLRVMVASDEGDTGFSEAVSRNVQLLEPEKVAARASDKCRLNHRRVSLVPGSYVTILEELAVADLVRFMATLGLNGQAVNEGRSFAIDRLGGLVVDPRITLRDDPWSARGLPMPFDHEGTPKRPISLIEKGVLVQVVHDLNTAAVAGTRSTGHAAPPDPEAMMGYPAPTNLFLDGGDSSVEEMIASTELGVLVTRLHYTNSPNPRRVTVTGMTRDGTFLIEDGRIIRALNNQRFHQGVLEMLNAVSSIGREPELHRDGHGGVGVSMQHGVVGASAHHIPALKVDQFSYIGESPVV